VSIGRRTFLLGTGAVVVAAACGGDDDTAASTTTGAAAATTASSGPSTAGTASTASSTPMTTTTEVPAVSVSLPTHPFWDGSVVVPDQALLDELAAAYVAATTGDPEMERFLFGTAPVEAFDRIFADPGSAEVPGLIWVLHLSGYFGGRWLRREIAAAQPQALLVSFSVEPTETTFRATEGRARTALDAAADDDTALLAYADASLFDSPPPPGSDDPVRGLADSFGYNQGYMLQILEAPPAGLETPARYGVTCGQLLRCEYASPKLADVDRFRAAVDRLADPADAAAASLAARLAPVEEAAIPRGRFVWSSGLSVQGFPQASYDQLLDVSSSFLETVQVTAGAMVQAVLDADLEAARAGAVANAAMTVWLGAYMMGLLDGTEPIELPEFA
jgi:hypothetical protein